MDPTVCWPKDEDENPRARILEAQARLQLLLEHGNHLPYNIYLGDEGQVPKDGLSG
jgi:hypothetical protein